MTPINPPKLGDGARVAVIGGGPAGAFFTYFLLDDAQRAGMKLNVDVYEPRDFDRPGPIGCNNCAGLISEWLVQSLAIDGINLPSTVVERGIDSYILHMDVGDVRIETPWHEKRIGAVHRGAGPRGVKEIKWRGFDSFLLEQVCRKGAHLIRGRVGAVDLRDGFPFVKMHGGEFQGYDLLAVAMGKNNHGLKMFEQLGIGYKPPQVTKTYIAEIYLGQEEVPAYLGSSMHVFLLNLPRLEVAALIPKGDYATMIMIGEGIDHELVHSFVSSTEVEMCLPLDWTLSPDLCHCSPVISLRGAQHPFADRIVFVGDCGVTRLYKDGIGSAYRTAKAAARTAVFTGIAAEDFRKQYDPLLRSIVIDNWFGRIVFLVTRVIQNVNILRRGVARMVVNEQSREKPGRQWMSGVLWDTFTGSAPYREVFFRTFHPGFWLRFIYEILAGIFSFQPLRVERGSQVTSEALGKIYHDGEVIFHQGAIAECMYVIQSGKVQVLREEGDKEVLIAVRGKGEIVGEMAIIEKQTRSATVRALGEARILTIDKRTFLRRVHEDPSLTYRIMQKMSGRIRELSEELARVKSPEPIATHDSFD